LIIRNAMPPPMAFLATTVAQLSIQPGDAMKTDSELKSDVQAELLWDPLVPEAKVGVSVTEGVVTLTGHLDAYAEKVAARRAAERVKGGPS
jgi:osmotically-inducible protein OsmY